MSALTDAVYRIICEGARSRADLSANPYAADTVQYLLHVQGWLQEDLRLALIASSPSYAAGQAGGERWFDKFLSEGKQR